MAEKRVQRKLAAILAANVAGYSRLMGEDEAGALAAVTSHISEVFEPEITAHHGRIINTMGDAVFAEFASVVDAVRCAVAVQEGMQERNSEIAEQRRIDFRIGVNLGDVIVQDDDVYGDGVRQGARALQARAQSTEAIEARRALREPLREGRDMLASLPCEGDL